jgi:uroporphyrinogen-III synthase
MLKVLDTRWPRAQSLAALGKTLLVVRGPKPLAVLREQGLQPALAVPEPNTWRDLVKALDDMNRPLKGMNVAVQEYGVSNAELLDALRRREATVTRVPVYRWMLPEDTGPLTRAVRALIQGDADVVLFTNAVQVDHVMQVAEQEGGADRLRQAMERMVVSAVGPIVAERLRHHRLPVDFEPPHPKMGILVKETGERAAAMLMNKRATRRS